MSFGPFKCTHPQNKNGTCKYTLGKGETSTRPKVQNVSFRGHKFFQRGIFRSLRELSPRLPSQSRVYTGELSEVPSGRELLRNGLRHVVVTTQVRFQAKTSALAARVKRSLPPKKPVAKVRKTYAKVEQEDLDQRLFFGENKDVYVKYRFYIHCMLYRTYHCPHFYPLVSASIRCCICI